MSNLPENAKLYIVQALARFTSPAEVVALVREELGFETTIQQVRTYNPEHPRFEAGERWRPIFQAVRKTYLEDIANIPIASQAFRLNALQKNFDRAMKIGNIVLANSILEQAGKEMGGALTNARNVTLSQAESSLRYLSLQERREAATGLIRNALSRRAPQVPHSPGRSS